MKNRDRGKENLFSSLLASFCTSLPLRSSSPALILSTPFLMVTVRGAHLFCSVVFCRCLSGDASFLCICTSRQGGRRAGGRAGGERMSDGWSVVLPYLLIRAHLWEYGNQRTLGTLLLEKVGAYDIRKKGFDCWCRQRVQWECWVWWGRWGGGVVSLSLTPLVEQCLKLCAIREGTAG